MDNNIYLQEILKYLKDHTDEHNRSGMKRFGINVDKAYGVNIPLLRKLAKKYKKNHELALLLWNSQFHEARILASMIDDAAQVTSKQMDTWVTDFNSWDLCDQTIANLFEDCELNYNKAFIWSEKKQEFIKRAGFVMMARLAVSDKKADDKQMLQFFPLIKKYATDDRNFVKKAVNWAIRQIGKRNKKLCKQAIKLCQEIKTIDSKSAKWIAANALQELTKKKFR